MYTLRVFGTLFAALRKLPRPSTIAPPVHKIIIIVLRISVLSWVLVNALCLRGFPYHDLI